METPPGPASVATSSATPAPFAVIGMLTGVRDPTAPIVTVW